MEGISFCTETAILIAFAATIVWVMHYAKSEVERRS